MYKIVFFTFDWNYEVVYEYNLGIQAFLKNHPDTNVYVINGLGRYGEQDPVSGNFRIYDIVNLEDFDAVLIQGNRSWPKEMRADLLNHAEALGIPAASLNYAFDNASYIGTDNYGAMKMMTTHLIQVHGVRSAVFVSGLSSSSEAQERKQAFLDTCRMYDLKEYEVLDGSWEVYSGRDAARQMLARDHMPDALVCANDDTCWGAAEEFREHGIRIPEDIIVTGFDNRDIARSHEPRLTTVSRDYKTVAENALNTLYEKIITHDLSYDRVHSPFQMVYSDSCGCGTAYESRRELKQKYYDMDASAKTFHRVSDKIQPEMLEAETAGEIMEILERSEDSLQVGNSCFVFDNGYLEDINNASMNRRYTKTALLCGIFGDQEKGETDQAHVYRRFETSEILPEDMQKQGGTLYIVYPVKVGEICVGYFVTEGVSIASKYNFLQTSLTLIGSAIENVRQKILMSELNGKLGNLYIKDQLSGLYNRFGLERFGRHFYESMLRNDGEVWIDFIDLDDMKGINDQHGHEAGDQAIRDTAEILQEAINVEPGFCIRYGGDEFVIIGQNSLRRQIEESVLKYKETHERSFDLGLSVGEICVQKDTEFDLDYNIRLADEAMYQIKKRRKEMAAEAVASE